MLKAKVEWLEVRLGPRVTKSLLDKKRVIIITIIFFHFYFFLNYILITVAGMHKM